MEMHLLVTVQGWNDVNVKVTLVTEIAVWNVQKCIVELYQEVTNCTDRLNPGREYLFHRRVYLVVGFGEWPYFC